MAFTALHILYSVSSNAALQPSVHVVQPQVASSMSAFRFPKKVLSAVLSAESALSRFSVVLVSQSFPKPVGEWRRFRRSDRHSDTTEREGRILTIAVAALYPGRSLVARW